MEPTDITIEVLKGIRDEVRQGLARTNERLDMLVEGQIRQGTAINGRLDRMNDRLGGMEDRLDGVSGRLDLVVHATVELTREVKNLGGRIDNVLIGPMGQQVKNLEARVTRLEDRASSPPSR